MKLLIFAFCLIVAQFWACTNVPSLPKSLHKEDLALAADLPKENGPNFKVSYEDFMALVIEVQPYRAKRRVDLDSFLAMSKEPNTIILDTRSKEMYDRKHLKGAVNLNFSDFNSYSLASAIPSKDTKVLIYCNNNFEGDEVLFRSKTVTKFEGDLSGNQGYGDLMQPAVSSRKATRRTLALNIPTFINLYGYGYRNVYELSSLVNVRDSRLDFEGSESLGAAGK